MWFHVPGVNSHRNFDSACTPSFSARVITWLEPAIQLKTSTWSEVNLKKKHATLVSSYPEPTIWSCDTGQWIPCFDSCFDSCPISKMYAVNCQGCMPWSTYLLEISISIHARGSFSCGYGALLGGPLSRRNSAITCISVSQGLTCITKSRILSCTTYK